MKTEPNYGIQARKLIRRLIAEGSEPIAFHVYRRVAADRVYAGTSLATDALSWLEIAEWAQREGLLNQEQARLLRHVPPLTPGGGSETHGTARAGNSEPVKGRAGEDMESKETPNTQADATEEEGIAP